MAYSLFLRITDPEQRVDGNSPVAWSLYDAQHQRIAGQATMALRSVAAALPEEAQAGCRIVVLLPGHSILVREVTVARSHARHLKSAVIHAVEEHLAEPAEDVHVAIGKEVPSGQASLNRTYMTGVIRDEWLRRLLQTLTASGLVPDTVSAETLLLPCAEGLATAVFDNGAILFRMAGNVASSLVADTFLTFFENYLAQQKAPAAETVHTGSPPKIQTLQLWTVPHVPVAQEGVLDRLRTLCGHHAITVEPRHFDGDAFNWLCSQWLTNSAAGDSLNFLQGPYQDKDWAGPLASRGKAIAAVVAAWVFLQTAFGFGVNEYLYYKASRFHEQSLAIYRGMFPKDTKIVDLKAQTEQHLKNGDAAGGGFIALLGVLTGKSELARHLDIDKLTYDAQKNELVADATADAAIFEQFKRLAANPSVAVEVASVSDGAKGAHGEIHIRGQR